MATGRIVDLWHRKDRTRTARYGTGKRWQAVWTDNTGKETKKSFTLRDAAQAWIDNQTHENILIPGGLKQPILFEKYYALWIEKQAHQRPNSIRTLTNHCKNWVVPTFQGKYLQQIEQADIQRAVYAWQDSNAVSTTKLMLRYTAQIFKEAVHDKYLRESPCQRIKLRQDDFEDDEISSMAFSDETYSKLCELLRPIFRDAAVIAGSTGLRPKELIGLSKSDIDFRASEIRLSKQDTSTSRNDVKRGPLKTKYSKRKISFGPELGKVLRRLCNAPGEDGRLFHDNGPLLYWRFVAEWERVEELLPAIGPGWHQLRHYHASVLIARGMSPVAVANRLGHKDATVTLQVYAHMWSDDSERMAAIGDSVALSAPPSATEPTQAA